MEILTNFGVEWKLLLAQIVNFAILLFVLKKILYTPLLKMLEDRRDRILQSEKNADEIEKRLEKIEKDREKTFEKVSQETTHILEEATKNAAELVEEAKQTATVEVNTILEKTRTEIEQDRQKMRQEIKAELAELVAVAMTNVYAKKLTKADQEEIVRSTLRTMTKN